MDIKDSRVEGSSAKHVIPCVKLGDQEPLNPLWSPEGEEVKLLSSPLIPIMGYFIKQNTPLWMSYTFAYSRSVQ